MTALLEVNDLSLKIGSKYIFDNVNVAVQGGENCVLFGLNGCGKTTLLSVLSGFQAPSHGEISWQGQLMDQEHFADIRKEIGFVSSSFFGKIFRDETVLDIVLSGKFGALGVQDDITGEDIRNAKALLDIFGLRKTARYPYDILSKGQQQIVLIARALMGHPKLLLLDEPCSGLDIIAKERFLYVIRTLLSQYDLTLLYVTHQPDEITNLFSQAILMKTGEIFAQGAIKDIFNDAVMSEFLGVEASCFYSKNRLFIDLGLSQTEKAIHIAQGGGYN